MKLHGALLLCLVAQLASADQGACVLPVPDGGGVVPSPPSLVGVIVEAGPRLLVVRQSGGLTHKVAVSDATELFTVYGGGFELAELKAGQHAIIWLDDCSLPSANNHAAVLQVCSLAAEPCPG